MTDGNDGAVAANDGRFGGVLSRDEQARNGLRTRVGRHRQDAAHRSDGAIEGQLTHEQRIVIHLGRQNPCRRENADRDGHVEGSAVLAQIGRRKIHGDAPERIF
jgi:hypothetical protein